MPMDDDSAILAQISDLVAEEQSLRERHLGVGLHADDRTRLTELEQRLDQAWDLLRQRRAREEFGQSPDGAEPRSVGDVESYLQ